MQKLGLALLTLLLTATQAYATLDQAPPNFSYKKSKAVFVDFKKAVYTINYDLQKKEASVDTTVLFYMPQAGHPLFDLVPNPTNVTINGVKSSANEISDPDKASKLRVLNTLLSPGMHTLKMRNVIDTNITFNQLGVASGFWMGDLTDRKFLEQYIPSNYEYDQFAIEFIVNFKGAKNLKHIVKTNGTIKNLKDGSSYIQFPDYYTSSSVFFHVFPEGLNLMNVMFDYHSIDGRILPVDIYTSVDMTEWPSMTKQLLTELEKDYGPFPHQKVLIYGNSLRRGGMEYAGATVTGLPSLGHELFHSYNARGVMPANGNSGWMDEAMASWRDNKSPLAKELSFEATQLAAHSVWQRNTDRMAYVEGSAFLSMVAYKMNEKGFNLKEVLNEYYKTFMHKTVTTKTFEKKILDETGLDFTADFNKYIYDKKAKATAIHRSNDHHPEYTKEELLEMTMPGMK